MSETKFNPSQQVERIREVLVGREMGRIERRVADLETATPPPSPFLRASEVQNQMPASQSVAREIQELKIRIQKEAATRRQELVFLAQKIETTPKDPATIPPDQEAIENHVSLRMEKVAAEMTALIDARTREILHHLQNEILQWKNQTDRDLQSIRDVKADKKEITNRFARIASAAMENESSEGTPEGYLL